MSALRETPPATPVGPGNGGPASGRSSQARRPTATRPVGAAGQARRSLQRDLARREANLRISRRVSGPVGGVQRPPLDGQATAQATAMPGARLIPANPGQPSQRPAPAAPQARRVASPTTQPPRRAAQPQARVAQPQGRATNPQARAAQQQARATQPQARLTPAPLAPYGVAPSRAATASAGPAFAAATQPQVQAARSFLRALPGGAEGLDLSKARRLSNPAMLIVAISLLVLTAGAVVALQIRMTQVNERIGADLAAITVLQQTTVQARERNSRLASGARVDDAARGSLIEPDVEDQRFLSTGNRAATAEKAAKVLRQAPLASTNGGAPAATAGTAAGTTATGATGAGTGTTAAGAAATGTTAVAPVTPVAEPAPAATTGTVAP